jgi:hypothetical protein
MGFGMKPVQLQLISSASHILTPLIFVSYLEHLVEMGRNDFMAPIKRHPLKGTCQQKKLLHRKKV